MRLRLRLAILLSILPAVALADVNISAGQSNVQGIMDGGVYITNIEGNAAEVRQNSKATSRLLVGMDEAVWMHNAESTTLNSNMLEGSNVTMTVVQAVATGVTLNSNAGTGANTSARECSIQKFNYTADKPLVWKTHFQRTTTTQLNETVEMGFANMTAATAPTDGAFFRWNNAGNFVAVVAFNSVETSSATLTAPTITVWHTATIVKRIRDARFYIDDVLVATVSAATSDPNPWSSQLVGACWRVVIGASTPAAAPILRFAQAIVLEEGAGTRDKETMLAQMGRSAWTSPSAFTQTANHANSTSPVSATLSNTAAGYTTLGGRYQFAAPLGAVTDFALFGFQVPTGFRLNVTHVHINSCNTGAAVATTATILDWGLGINASAVSLATADALGPPATAWGPRRIPLGVQGFSLVAPRGPAQIGDCATDIDIDFHPPLVTDSARFFHVILQVPVGTATASQVIRGDVAVNGWFE